jgi:chromosome segregation ATPase
MENLRKKNETETQNTVEGHSHRLEQAEDRISGLEDKIEIKGKTEELLVKQIKGCERNMQELTNSIKRPNLRIMGIEEEVVQGKRICSIFNKIITENFPKILRKLCPFRYRKPPGHQTDLTKIELPHDILSLKQEQRIKKREKKNNIQR